VLPGQRLHSLTAARTGAHEDQLADEMGACSVISCATMPPIEKSRAHRLWSNKGSDEGDRVGAHLLERVGTSPELLETPAL